MILKVNFIMVEPALMRFPLRLRRFFLLSIGLAAALGGLQPALSATEEGARPVRVATLVPFAEQALGGLPAGRAEVVASVRTSPTSAVDRVVDLGSPHAPSLEALVGSRPDLVIADGAMHAALAPRLADVASVVLIDGSSVDGTFESLRRIGQAVRADDEMRAQIDEARRSLDQQRLREPVETLALFGTPSSLLAITSRTWLGDLLDEMNLDNLAAGLSGRETVPGYVLVSDEVLATMRPELIVVVAHGDPAAVRAALDARLGEGGAWSSLADGARIHVLEAERFAANPGLGMVDVARHLNELATVR